MVNKIVIKLRKIAAFPNSGKLFNNVETNLRILGIAFIDLRGLMTRRILTAFILSPPMLAKSRILK
jgi:hypothetical protein